MKRLAILLIIYVLTTSAVIAPLAIFFILDKKPNFEGNLFFGVTYGQDTVEGAKLLIDKVHTYTNIFVIDSSSINNNKTELYAVCNLAAEKTSPSLSTSAPSTPTSGNENGRLPQTKPGATNSLVFTCGMNLAVDK